MAPKKISRATRTKDDVKRQFSTLTKEASNQDAKSAALAAELAAKIKSSTDEFGATAAVTLAESLKTQIQDATTRLAELREAVKLETAELERLHKIDVAATSLDILLDEYKAKNAELEQQIAETKARWDADMVELATKRKRDEEQYVYNRDQQRKKEQEQFNEELRQAAKAEAERKADLERQFKLQSEELVRRAHQMKEAEKALAAENEKAFALMAQDTERKLEELKREHAYQLAAARSEAANTINLLEAEKRSLQADHRRIMDQLGDAYAQLAVARAEVKEISVAALQASSGREALHQVATMAKENGTQVKGRA